MCPNSITLKNIHPSNIHCMVTVSILCICKICIVHVPLLWNLIRCSSCSACLLLCSSLLLILILLLITCLCCILFCGRVLLSLSRYILSLSQKKSFLLLFIFCNNYQSCSVFDSPYYNVPKSSTNLITISNYIYSKLLTT